MNPTTLGLSEGVGRWFETWQRHVELIFWLAGNVWLVGPTKCNAQLNCCSASSFLDTEKAAKDLFTDANSLRVVGRWNESEGGFLCFEFFLTQIKTSFAGIFRYRKRGVLSCFWFCLLCLHMASEELCYWDKRLTLSRTARFLSDYGVYGAQITSFLFRQSLSCV